MKAKIERLEKSNADLKSKRASDRKKKRNGESGDEVADRVLERQLQDAQTELSECGVQLQELKDIVATYEHKLSLQNTKIGELEGQLQEKTTQNRLDKAKIENLGERLTESKKDVEWYKNLQFRPPTPSGALVHGSASHSLMNVVSPTF